MKVDFDIVLGRLDGQGTLKMNGAEARLGLLVANALDVNYAQEKIGANEKFRRGLLAEKAQKGGVVELTAADIKTIKDVIGYAYTPWVVMIAYRAIEGSDVDGEQDGQKPPAGAKAAAP